MSTTQSGRDAEEQVTEHLKNENHKIVALNWRTRWCEIDVVSKTKYCVYFTEVKYRSSTAWGDGFSYITPKKLSQMKFAAEMWLHDNNWTQESQLQAASVDEQGNIEVIELFY
jgi:uncharacterized protein (TIGR00252 family)